MEVTNEVIIKVRNEEVEVLKELARFVYERLGAGGDPGHMPKEALESNVVDMAVILYNI